MTYLELVREEAPTGQVRERTVEQGDLCRVFRTDFDTRRETKALDSLERANRKAAAWLRSRGRPFP